jgi:hypothetical protein
MVEQKRTLGPWYTNEIGNLIYVPTVGNCIVSIAEVLSPQTWVGDHYEKRGEGMANARFIVQACNSFEGLRDACKAWVDYFDKLDAQSDPDDPLAQARTQYHRKRIDATRAALQAAGEST